MNTQQIDGAPISVSEAKKQYAEAVASQGAIDLATFVKNFAAKGGTLTVMAQVLGMPKQQTRIDLDGGKYTVLHTNGTDFRALRYGDPWRELTGDKLAFAMACEIERLRAVRDEVHSWLVIAAATTPFDIVQNTDRICKITAPNYAGD